MNYTRSIDEEGGVKEFPRSYEAYKDPDISGVLSNSCNGMLLLSFGTSDIFLVNPSTHYIDLVLQVQDCFGNPDIGTSIGYCYDESIGDYKAVILISHRRRGDSMLVASLREKQWKTIIIPSNFCYILGGPLVNNRLHCSVRCCRDNDNQFGVTNAILYFDPVKDVFEKVAYPQPKSGDEDAIVGLGVLDDCLCMARRIGDYRDREGDVEVLKMKEYGVSESWASLFVLKNLDVNRYTGWFEPLLMTKNGDILIVRKENIYRYNPAKKLYTKLIKKRKNRWLNVVVVVENLSTPNESLVRSHDGSNI